MNSSISNLPYPLLYTSITDYMQVAINKLYNSINLFDAFARQTNLTRKQRKIASFFKETSRNAVSKANLLH